MSGDPSGSGKVPLTDEVNIRENLHLVPCVADEANVAFLRAHGRVFFLMRGLPGSGKNTMFEVLKECYPGAQAYWADKLFMSPMAPAWTKESAKESHRFCREKIETFMKEDVPVIICRNTNVTVWEISHYLRLAARYGYATILIDMNRKFMFNPQLLAVANSKCLNTEYMTRRMKQWEEVFPLATGWSPSAKDAVLLTRRFNHLRQMLSEEADLILDPLNNPEGFPFCLAKLCWFGWEEADRDYCCSQQVEQASGKKDTLLVFGYAILEGLVLALVKLSDAQLALCSARRDESSNTEDQEDEITTSFARSVSLRDWEATRCTVALEDIVGGKRTVDDLPRMDRLSSLPVSRTTFIILGSASDSFVYSRSLKDLHNRLGEAFCVSDEGAIQCEQKKCVQGVDVYFTDGAWLVLDDRCVELDAVFTGLYQPYVTPPPPRGPGSRSRGMGPRSRGTGPRSRGTGPRPVVGSGQLGVRQPTFNAK